MCSSQISDEPGLEHVDRARLEGAGPVVDLDEARHVVRLHAQPLHRLAVLDVDREGAVRSVREREDEERVERAEAVGVARVEAAG